MFILNQQYINAFFSLFNLLLLAHKSLKQIDIRTFFIYNFKISILFSRLLIKQIKIK
jgi:hypothetical protein